MPATFLSRDKRKPAQHHPLSQPPSNRSRPTRLDRTPRAEWKLRTAKVPSSRRKKSPETRNRTERNAYIHLMAGHRQLDGTLAASSASVSSARRRRCSSPEFVRPSVCTSVSTERRSKSPLILTNSTMGAESSWQPTKKNPVSPQTKTARKEFGGPAGGTM